MTIYLSKSDREGKKWMVDIDGKIIHFGSVGYDDYTKHKDDKRKYGYDMRHKVMEIWDKSGILTSGFWAKWILWNMKTMRESIKDTEKRFNIKIKRVYKKKN